MYVCLYVNICVCMYVCMYMGECICCDIYIYIYRLGSMAQWDNQKLESQRSRVRLQAVLEFLLSL